MLHRLAFAVLVSAVPLLGQQAPTHAVVPAAQLLADGAHAIFVAGTTEPYRELMVIDGSLLLPLQGRRLLGLAFRREAGDEAFAGGDATLTIELSHATRPWSDVDERFDANHGPDRTQVFQGTVTLPASPPAGPNVPWDAQNVLAIAFQAPFDYTTGALAVEVRGAPDAQNATEWWPADAVWQPSAGSAQSLGTGCGAFGGTAGEWSFLDATNLVPGGTARFTALGTPTEIACLVLGAGAQANAIDLAPLGAPGCHGHLQHVLGSLLTFFGPQLLAQQPATGGMASVAFRVPGSPSYLGLGLASQWLAFGSGGLVSSNAHAWSLASLPPALPMTLVAAPAPAGTPATGTVVPGCGHVLQFAF